MKAKYTDVHIRHFPQNTKLYWKYTWPFKWYFCDADLFGWKTAEAFPH